MLTRSGFYFVAVSFVVVVLEPVAAEELPSPVALLRGAKLARTQHDTLKATLRIRYVEPAPAKTVDCLVEQDNDKRRFEVFAGEVEGQVIIRDGDDFLGYRRKDYEDVQLYDVKRATGVRGDLAFDPRVLGLSDLMTCNITVEDCLWYDDFDEIAVTGRESLRGVSVWKVKVTRRGSTSEYWIEEPTFRVHRRTVDTPSTHIELESEFTTDDANSPIPQRVTAKRVTSGNLDYECVFDVNTFEPVSAIPSNRFTLESMDLPVNVAAVDYRINRIVGYWDGEQLSPTPVYRGETPANRSMPAAQGMQRSLIILGNLAIVVFLAYFVWKRRRSLSNS